MNARAFLHCLPLALPLVLGCQKNGTPALTDAGPPQAPPSFSFTPDRGDLLFSYVDERGNVQSVDKANDVPEKQRTNVMVVDLTKAPEDRQSDKYVYFVDLTVKDPEGRFVANVVSRYHAAAEATAAGEFVADAKRGDVMVYSASWCGFCKKTKAFLKQNHVPYIERDVEKDPGAEAELQQKARKAGVAVSGVPVTDFMGELVMGFDKAKLQKLIQQRAAAAPAGPGP